jgi:hypothetical protein
MEAEARDLLTRAVAPERASGELDRAARLRRAQETVERFIRPGSYTIDQFLVERREEAAAEEAKWDRLNRKAGGPPVRPRRNG